MDSVINPPPESIKNIPVIGRKLDETWLKASTDFSQVAQENKERIKNVLIGFFGLLSSIIKGILLLAAAVILGAVLMYFGQPAGNFANAFFRRLAGEDGADMAKVAEVTIRNVTRGILGVAFIQSMLAGIGMVIGGVPLAGLWTLLCLMLAIVQIPILPVAIGVIIYMWTSDASTAMAVIITVWMLIVGLIDNVLKPLMLGKGAPVPMLVVFLGAIGGFIFTGFTGLFTGAIVLSLAYKLFDKWMKSGSSSGVTVVSSTAPQ
jgi:predicted PurR-regulated permease PerM